MKCLLRTGFWVAVGAAVALAALEAVLHFLPVAGRGVYAAEYDPDWPINHLLPDSRYTYSAGWKLDLVHEGRVNNMGYVAPFDYQPGAGGIAVLGDSYVESLMNDYAVTLQGRLRNLLEQRVPVMAFGSSGASMPDYLATAGLVAGRFHPAWGVLLVTETDFTEGFAPIPGNYGWNGALDPPIQLNRQAPRGALAGIARRVALVRYFRYNLKVRPADMIALHPAPTADTGAPADCLPWRLSDADESLVEAFAARLPAQFRLPADRIVVVFDSTSDRKSIYSSGVAEACVDRNAAANTALRHHLAAAGVHVVATGELFADYFRSHHRKVDHSPLDWHWNAEAHALVAAEVAAIINAHGGGSVPPPPHAVPACGATQAMSAIGNCPFH